MAIEIEISDQEQLDEYLSDINDRLIKERARKTSLVNRRIDLNSRKDNIILAINQINARIEIVNAKIAKLVLDKNNPK